MKYTNTWVALSLLGILLSISCQPPTCEEMAQGMERDQCFHDRIATLPAAQVSGVIDAAGQINDPMVRGAAVSSWVEVNVGKIPQAEGHKLCSFLEGRDQSYCERRLSSPHLQR